MWMRYLIAGGALAVTRVALLVWLNHRAGTDTRTDMDYLLAGWLYPEAVVSIFWHSLVASHGPTMYYLTWGPLVVLGSFVLATPILFVRWLRQRNVIVQCALCGLTIPVFTVLLLVIVRLVGAID